ncbi:O-methyltransferase 1, chloroplastic isoform X2 [Macadamia integrifolia]|uniref:O-methyltransferase 1, chloroplastic isoform X2 n=1 Tax=Macadamia integrifolia TaxID=60698 RepID=UPI001C4FA649|nr:O-methyltransferase 1, chloroplastic isoform X2 [Macadamia integrifolia]
MRTGWSRFPIHDSQALRLDLALQMRCLCLFPAAAVILVRPQLSRFSAKKRHGRLTAQLRNHDDPLLQAAIDAASLRFEETCKPEPLFLDPYAGCFIGSDTNEDMKLSPSFSASLHHYCLATKFIDDKLLSTINLMEGLRQVSGLRFQETAYSFMFRTSALMYKRSCKEKGLWVASLVFGYSSCLATKGSLLVGELPIWLTETEVGNKSTTQKWMDKLFLSNGFQVEIIDFKDVARSVGRNPPLGGYKNILFVAEQLRLSDDQMESWRREYHRIEEEADEEGFEEI